VYVFLLGEVVRRVTAEAQPPRRVLDE